MKTAKEMLEQLKEMLKMQKELDKSILDSHNLKYNYEVADKVQIALQVELGELMNELPTKFKYWKNTAKDNREKALVEYVDCLHFMMSLFNFYKIDFDKVVDYRVCIAPYTTETLAECLRKAVLNLVNEKGIRYLFTIGNLLGFTWDEVYKAYKLKNAVNYERIKKGY